MRRYPESFGCDMYPPNFAMNCMFEESAKTLTNGTCAGHHNHVVFALEGNGSRPSHRGDGYVESDVSYTLNATEQHGVAYGLDRASFNQGKNAKYDFTIQEEIEPTLVSRGPGAIAYGLDAYNQSVTEEQSITIREPAGGDNKAMVIEGVVEISDMGVNNNVD